MNRETLTTIIALAVSFVWTAVALASLFLKDYTALGIVTPVMLIVAGFLFGLKVTRDTNGHGK
jgi:hypothetical protein